MPQDKKPSSFVPVPRPLRGKTASQPATATTDGGNTLDRWLNESVHDQPFNNVASVRPTWTKQESSQSTQHTSSSTRCHKGDSKC
ncbi:hypothetical protein CDD82_820 [Ophiocordyceps australis]|uniref:Uncharacterized protein n=1 Tax=Ophiocordyceps australis TaxID=1399860 RepID=A0A2C5ZNM6_9HYPO|nr:hypothetical protein CDD82_820 [Ophiocordyceps australis]